MADVKELIPEFFYLPEFLVNSNNFDLGKRLSQLNYMFPSTFLFQEYIEQLQNLT